MSGVQDPSGGEHNGLENNEGDKSISFSQLPTTEEELNALKLPKNEWLPWTLRSEAFDIGD